MIPQHVAMQSNIETELITSVINRCAITALRNILPILSTGDPNKLIKKIEYKPTWTIDKKTMEICWC